MRVFVLNSGRCGSSTFAAACQYITNYTSGHETLATRKYGLDRFDYPDQHIEVGNRLTWFLGDLDRLFGKANTFWVHLRRDREATALSYYQRWDTAIPSAIVPAFSHAIVMNDHQWTSNERMELCRFYVRTVNTNISYFLKDRIHVIVRLESFTNDFTRFWKAIDAEGDLESALTELNRRHNATPSKSKTTTLASRVRRYLMRRIS